MYVIDVVLVQYAIPENVAAIKTHCIPNIIDSIIKIGFSIIFSSFHNEIKIII